MVQWKDEYPPQPPLVARPALTVFWRCGQHTDGPTPPHEPQHTTWPLRARHHDEHIRTWKDLPMEHTGVSIEDLNLTPEGLADAPANQTDPDSLVHVENS